MEFASQLKCTFGRCQGTNMAHCFKKPHLVIWHYAWSPVLIRNHHFAIWSTMVLFWWCISSSLSILILLVNSIVTARHNLYLANVETEAQIRGPK